MIAATNARGCVSVCLLRIVISVMALAGAHGGSWAQESAESRVTQTPRSTVDKDGTVNVPAFAVPLSSAMSPRAKALYIEQARQKPAAGAPAKSLDELRRNMVELRKMVDDYHRPLMERGKALYPVNIQERTIAGVRTDVVTPKDGISERNRVRVLINLHGGGFEVGGGLGQLVESMPIASKGKIKVISIDYRMAPEYKFPAASEDVAMVYKELLRQYKPENIGIYGCSAGGLLTAQAVAWLQKEGITPPGAIGIFCAGADADFSIGGDSRYTVAALASFGKSPAPLPETPPWSTPYLSGVDEKDPLVSPAVSQAVLAKFPPTLLIVGGRDLNVSSVAYTHSRFIRAGVDADLHIWEGMWHNFLFEMDMPESIEAYDVIMNFFDKHLGGK